VLGSALFLLLLLGAALTLTSIDVQKYLPWAKKANSKPARDYRWYISIYQGPTPLNLEPALGVDHPVMAAIDVTDVPATFVADPFMLPVGDTWYMFFEVLNAQTNQGDIGYATSPDGLHWAYQSIVLDEPFHLSYPYVFEWEDDYYMIPEAGETGAVHLYRSTSFPTGWVEQTSLLTGSAVLDPSTVYYNGTWWMFTSSVTHDTLRLFFADDLTGPWQEHPRSPLIEGDPNIARPGGRVLQYDGHLLRIAQDDHPYYGNQVRAFEISALTRTSYAETELTASPLLTASGSGWNASGMHQLDAWQKDATTWIAAVDGMSAQAIYRSKRMISQPTLGALP
jgi:hypothetical protein